MDSKISKLKRKKESSYANSQYDSTYRHCIELAELLVESENYEEALMEYKEAEQAGEMCNNPMHIARANRMISEVYVMMQKPKDAIQYVVKYLEISRKERDLKEEQRALATLARVHFINAEDLLPSKEREEALAHAQQYNIKSLKICDRLEGECSVSAKNIGEMRARVYLNLGLVEEALGNLEKAIQYLGKAVLVCKTLDLWEELCLSYTNLGLTHKHNADFASALKAFDLGLTVACRLSEKGKYMSDLYVQKALVLLELPDFRRAKHSLHKAYKLKTSAPSEQAEIGKKLKIVAAMSEYEEKLIHLPENSVFERRKIYESMGDGCAALESYRKALVYYHSSLECSEKLNESGKKASEILVSLAQTYKDLKDYDKAVQYYNRELTVWKDNPAEACNTSLSIAEVLELKNASSREILTIYRSALCLARDAKSLKLERIVLKNMLTHLNENMNSVMASEIEKELKKVERHFENQSDSESNSESEDTPAIGDHISLDALSDSEADEDEAKLKARTARRVRSCFQLRRNEKGETPLHVACINGNLSHVSKLLDQGHPVDVRDNNGWTPLHEAANYGYVEIVRELIDRGASINDPGGPHCDGVTPLLDAASCGHFLVMNLLLEKGASPIVRTDKGETVLDCLRNWRRRYIEEEHSDLTGETLNDYKTIAGKIKLAIEKTGHHVSHEKISDSLSRSRSSSRTDHFESRSSKSSKPSRNLSPILSSKAMRRKSSERRSLSRSPIRTEYPSSTSDKSAVSEYQSAIRGLKYRSTVNSEVPVSPIKVSQGALVDAENVVDDWLIDDMKEPTTLRPSKRRRRDDLISGIQLRNPSHKAKFENHNPSNASTVESMVEYSDDEICDSNDIKHRPEDCSSKDDIVNDSSTVRSDLENLKGDNVFPNNIYEATPCNQYGTQSTNNLSCSQKRQSTLHKAALTREPVQTADSVPITTEVYQKRHIIKVGIEGKTFLVPLPNDPDLTISWLAEETARRYHSMEGAEPKLDLKTVEGALLYPQDPLSLLRDVGSEVNAVVTAWNLASIAERYTDTCVANNLEVLSEVKAALDTAQSTSCLDLGESVLSKDELLPVFKAISHQNSLRYLRLNGNLLEDSGLKVLLESLVHMSQLRELSLRCCSISQNGLSEMCQFILEKNVFKALQVIDMSYNFLGDDCLGQLCDVISKLPSLHTLRLQSNYLTTFKAKQDYFLDQIEVLNLSQNKIGRQSVQEILSKLNPDKIRSLNLAYCGESVALEVAIFLANRVPHNLEELDLSYCDVCDDEMEQLFQCLKVSPRLRKLTLQGNDRLSQSTVEKLTQLQLSHLNLAGVECKLLNIEHSIEALYYSMSGPIQGQLPAGSFWGPFGLFSNNLHSLLKELK